MNSTSISKELDWKSRKLFLYCTHTHTHTPTHAHTQTHNNPTTPPHHTPRHTHTHTHTHTHARTHTHTQLFQVGLKHRDFVSCHFQKTPLSWWPSALRELKVDRKSVV